MVIADALGSRENNFDHLRLIAAVAVIVSHSFSIVGLPEPPAPFYGNTWGAVGVAVFMVISGFLVTKSWFRTENPVLFFKYRFLRISPALFVVILLTVFVMGPVVTSLPLKDYFLNKDTYHYLLSNSIFYIQYNLPGVFAANPVKDTVNGSIWTLRFEFAMYFVLAFLGMTKLLKKKAVSVLIFAVLLSLTPIADTVQLNHLIYLPMFFMAGVLFYLYREVIPLRGSYALVCVVIFVLSSFTRPLGGPLLVIFGSYLLFYVALEPKLRLPQLTKIGDFSYGIYIYAFPVQQMIAWFFKGRVGYAQELILSLIFTFAFAFLSWHLVERRALSLKNRALLHRGNFENKEA